MKKLKTSLLCLTLSMILMLTMFSGCGKNESSDSSGTTVTTTSVSSASASVETPVVKIVIPFWGQQTSAEKTKYYDQVLEEINKKLEADKGFKIAPEVLTIPVDQYSTKVNLMISSGEQVDLVENLGTYSDIVNKGVCADLTGALESVGQGLKKAFAKEIWDQFTVDGKIYGAPIDQFPYVYAQLVRKDWLDKLGLSMPKTFADYEKMLYAMKDGDLNGTGKKDVVPLTGVLFVDNGNALSPIESTFYGSFSKTPGKSFVDSNGVMQPRYMDPGYKELIKKLAQWYKDGIIDDSIFTNLGDNNAQSALMAKDKLAVVADNMWTEQWGPYNTIVKSRKDVNLQYIYLLDDVNAYPATAYTSNWWFVPATSQNLESVVKLMDWYWSDYENYLLVMRGIKDLTYTVENGIIDIPAAETNNLVDTVLGKQLIGPYIPVQNTAFSLKTRNKVDDEVQFAIYNHYINNLDPSKAYVSPDATITLALSEKAKLGINNGRKAADNYIHDFITGKKDFSQWDRMIEEWKKAGGELEYQEYNAALKAK